METALEGASDLTVTEFKYRYAASTEAHVLFSVGIRSSRDLAELLDRLNGAGMSTMDLSKIEAAQVHLRHMVGGRARSYTGSIPDERIFVVEFPERPGALKRFLEASRPSGEGGLSRAALFVAPGELMVALPCCRSCALAGTSPCSTTVTAAPRPPQFCWASRSLLAPSRFEKRAA